MMAKDSIDYKELWNSFKSSLEDLENKLECKSEVMLFHYIKETMEELEEAKSYSFQSNKDYIKEIQDKANEIYEKSGWFASVDYSLKQILGADGYAKYSAQLIEQYVLTKKGENNEN